MTPLAGQWTTHRTAEPSSTLAATLAVLHHDDASLASRFFKSDFALQILIATGIMKH